MNTTTQWEKEIDEIVSRLNSSMSWYCAAVDGGARWNSNGAKKILKKALSVVYALALQQERSNHQKEILEAEKRGKKCTAEQVERVMQGIRELSQPKKE